ncbi:MAG: SPOR domain-containing protein [Bacteroidia bacterium]|nr:SPOR domain-containing protein [Bacteroidia bacterium]NNJ56038.1 SPOR domain-containing protein [Bacteroidia bacterium]
MNFVKWLGYLLLLGLFVWFVFFREIGTRTGSKDMSTNLVEDSENDEYVDDEASFIDEPIEEQFEQQTEEESFEEFEEETADVVETEPVVEAEPVEEITPITTTGIDLNKKYLIVVGSFGNRANADRMLKRVKDSGKDGVIEKIRGLNRVITASTDDQNDAQNLRDHFTHIYKETSFILER